MNMNIATREKLELDLPLDEGIRSIVETLREHGVETFESCEGGAGHSFPEPTVRFHGGYAEGFRALSVAIAIELNVLELRRVYGVHTGEVEGPWWELTFSVKNDRSIREKGVGMDAIREIILAVLCMGMLAFVLHIIFSIADIKDRLTRLEKGERDASHKKVS